MQRWTRTLFPLLAALACGPARAQQPPAPPEPAPAPPASESPAPVSPLTFGGQVDLYWGYNLNRPWTGTNGLSVFDVRNQDGLNLGLIDLWAQYARGERGIGGRIDLMWGPTGRFANFLERQISRDDVWDHVQQAFLSVNLSRDGRTYADFGRWVTPAGAEVIEPRDNWLYSRGLLFGFAIPFTHTGLRVYHYFNDTDYVMAHVNTGWDSVSWRDTSPGFGLTVSKLLTPQWTLVANYMGGDEPGPNGKDSFRHLLDLVALYTPNARWAWTLNADVATQEGGSWYGVSAQAKYTLNPRSYLAARGEVLVDNARGFRIGADTTAASLTLGYTYLWNRHFQTRAEFRYDLAGEDLFPDRRRGRFTDHQPRFLIAAIAGF